MDKFEIRRLNILDLLRVTFHDKQADFARATGIDPSYVSRMLYVQGKKGKKNIGDDTLEAIQKACNVAPGVLDTPGGLLKYLEANGSDRRLVISNVEPGPNIRGEYPLISWVQAGKWMDIVDNFNPGDAENYFPCPKKCGPNTFMLRVRGRSMQPKYQDGDLIYVDPSAVYQHHSNVVVKLTDDQEATFKRLVIDGSKMWIEPLNPDWPEKAIKLEESARIVGVVIGKWVPD
jgi:SOS-response transcriptional repressor LexA